MKCLFLGGPLTSSSQNLNNNNSPGTPPGNRAIMSSPFSVLSRPEHAFAHIHPQGHQVCSRLTPHPTSSQPTSGHNNSQGTPMGNRATMSSPFCILSRPEYAFAHIHPQRHQVCSLLPLPLPPPSVNYSPRYSAGYSSYHV